MIAIHRAATREPLTDMEFLCATLVGLGMTAEAMSRELGIATGTVRHHLKLAARKIPGDLPAMSRLSVWVRGGDIDILEGRSLRFQIMQRQIGENGTHPQSGDVRARAPV